MGPVDEVSDSFWPDRLLALDRWLLLRRRRCTVSRIDIETKRKLREMGVATLLDAFDVQDDTLSLGLAFEEKI